MEETSPMGHWACVASNNCCGFGDEKSDIPFSYILLLQHKWGQAEHSVSLSNPNKLLCLPAYKTHVDFGLLADVNGFLFFVAVKRHIQY